VALHVCLFFFFVVSFNLPVWQYPPKKPDSRGVAMARAGATRFRAENRPPVDAKPFLHCSVYK
jgi:hypothetical protein